MVPFAVLEGIVLSIWATLTGTEGPIEIVQQLENDAESLRARIEDVQRDTLSNKVKRGKKRKREDDLQHWVTEARLLVKEVDDFRGVGKDKNFLTCAKMRKVAHKTRVALANHEEKLDDMLLTRALLPNRQGPRPGAYIPVQELIGQVASTNFGTLQALLQDDKVGRVAIHGMKGIGKTFLMKHLHNSVLKWVERFDYVFWVTLSDQFNIKHVQDAVAAAVRCDLSNIDDLFLRAQKLSCTLAGLERFVLFLDAAPEASFSLEEVGLPVPVEGSMCKLVITTNSALVCGMLACFGNVKLGPLHEVEACQLLMHKASVDMDSVSLLDDIASSLAKECCGVPRMIVDVATRLRGIDDICEWSNALSELKNHVQEDRISLQAVIDN